MHYSLAFAAVLAFVSSVFAAATPGFDAISSPTQDQVVIAGSPLDIIWAPEKVTGTITITLLQGPNPSSLAFGPVVAANIENSLGKFVWTNTSGAAGFATYGFEISLDSAPTTIQYSNPFHITGGASNSSSSSSSYTGTPLTTTYHVATGTAYTTVATSASNSSTISVKPTSSAANATTTLVSNTTTLATTTSSPATNTPPAASTSAAGSAAPTATQNAAANIATGGLAMIGGLLFAFAF